ncbi:hypothetical protein OFB92_31420, partial [Escherichia coli]|nr:hypothetical protein [Escherichia coli]
VQRAVELYEQWKANPADFSVKTRTTGSRRKSAKTAQNDINKNESLTYNTADAVTQVPPSRHGTYQSSFPVGTGRVITISNIPDDLTTS